jgi:general secretion pathway protein F
MPAFRYQAYSSAGQLETGTIEAASISEAVKLLNERALLPFSTEAVGESERRRRSWRTAFARQRLSLEDYADMARELSVLLNAGLPLDQALRLLAEQASGIQTKGLVRKLLESVTAGMALSAALEQHAPLAPSYVFNLIRAGEARGSLATTLADLASFLQKRADIQARVRSALTYPMVLGITALGAVTVIITFLVPALLPFFSETGVEPPLAFAIAQTTGALISRFWPVLLFAALLGALLASWLLRREDARLFLDRLVLRLPVIGDVVAKTNTAALARTLGTLLRNGVALVPALSMTAAVVPSRPFAHALKASADGVREGRRLGVTIGGFPDLPMLLVRFIAIGEEASKLDEMLLHLADISDVQAERQIERLMTLLTPTLTILIGVVVGGLILSVMQAILGVNQLAFQ